MSKKNYSEDKIKSLMDNLDLTREEAIELLEYDSDNLESEEANELTQKAKSVEPPVKRGRKPRAKGEGTSGVTQLKRTKKENPTKLRIMLILANALQENDLKFEVTNAEKTIIIELDGNTFEIDLKQKRQPKA